MSTIIGHGSQRQRTAADSNTVVDWWSDQFMRAWAACYCTPEYPGTQGSSRLCARSKKTLLLVLPMVVSASGRGSPNAPLASAAGSCCAPRPTSPGSLAGASSEPLLKSEQLGGLETSLGGLGDVQVSLDLGGLQGLLQGLTRAIDTKFGDVCSELKQLRAEVSAQLESETVISNLKRFRLHGTWQFITTVLP